MSTDAISPASQRFAIYFTPPPGSALSRFGATCLGRDAYSGVEETQPPIDGVSADRWRAMTASARMYGFHATLKPPFHLAAGTTQDDLINRIERLAAERDAFDTPPLRVARIADFFALVLS